MPINIDINFIKGNEGPGLNPYFDEGKVSIGPGVNTNARSTSEFDLLEQQTNKTLRDKVEIFQHITGSSSHVNSKINQIVAANPTWYPLTITESDLLWDWIYTIFLNKSTIYWNDANPTNNCTFENMQEEVQTVWYDMIYQFGSNNSFPNFTNQMTTGDWPAAINNLRTWTVNQQTPSWQNRNNARADRLEEIITNGTDAWPCPLIDMSCGGAPSQDQEEQLREYIKNLNWKNIRDIGENDGIESEVRSYPDGDYPDSFFSFYSGDLVWYRRDDIYGGLGTPLAPTIAMAELGSGNNYPYSDHLQSLDAAKEHIANYIIEALKSLKYNFFDIWNNRDLVFPAPAVPIYVGVKGIKTNWYWGTSLSYGDNIAAVNGMYMGNIDAFLVTMPIGDNIDAGTEILQLLFHENGHRLGTTYPLERNDVPEINGSDIIDIQKYALDTNNDVYIPSWMRDLKYYSLSGGGVMSFLELFKPFYNPLDGSYLPIWEIFNDNSFFEDEWLMRLIGEIIVRGPGATVLDVLKEHPNFVPEVLSYEKVEFIQSWYDSIYGSIHSACSSNRDALLPDDPGDIWAHGYQASVARKGYDRVSEHHCGVIPRTATGSDNVFVNNISVHRESDTNTSHPYEPTPAGCPEHITKLINGSPTVFVNNKPIARIGDSYECGITITTGSNNVFAHNDRRAYTFPEKM